MALEFGISSVLRLGSFRERWFHEPKKARKTGSRSRRRRSIFRIRMNSSSNRQAAKDRGLKIRVTLPSIV